MITAPPHASTYHCDGETTAFSFRFRVTAESDLEVLRIGADGHVQRLLLNHDYSVEGAGASGGGKVHTLADAPYPPGDKLMIWLDVPLVQPVDYVENDAFPAQSHEDALDRLTLIAAQTRADIDRSLRFPLGSESQVLPSAYDRSGRFLAFNSAGDVIVTPAIADPIVIEELDQALVYMDRNADTEPRLVLDVNGFGSAPHPDIGGEQAIRHCRVMLQDKVPLLNEGVTRFHIGMVFDGQPDEGHVDIDNKRSRGALGISVLSKISTEPDTSHPGKFLPQECGCLVLTATAAACTDRAKVEAIVVSAREEDGLPADKGSKGVAIQAITQRVTAGPKPDDRHQLNDSEDGPDGVTAAGDPETEPTGPGYNLGSFTLRLNGGTIKVWDEAQDKLVPVFGGYRSWSAVMAGGRAGYFNGVVMTKRHGVDPDDPHQSDPEDVGGWGGVWGGRSFWHQDTFAVNAKDACPGWVCIGHDGIPNESNGDDGLARAPIDIQVRLSPAGAVPDAWKDEVTGGAVLSFNGERLLAPRQAAIANASSGQEVAKINAILNVLRAHGLIGE